MKHELPQLPYEYDALEPYIDAQTMKVHHTKHHQGYVDKLNAALEGTDELAERSLEELLRDLDGIPEDVRTAVRNNGGGHYNHSLFWRTLKPNGGGNPEGEVKDAINSKFESFDGFKEAFAGAATGVFGSGWVWLVVNTNGNLDLYGMPNQDSPLMNGHTPILGLDVWEHAYYLKYQNRRPEYIDAFWNVVNWQMVVERLDN